ncbi:hypothetical protein EGH82_23630, partial [Vibrio ponticus]
MYHCIMLENIYDLIQVVQFFEPKSQLLNSLNQYPDKMLEWLIVMSHLDGKIPKFNDSAIGFAPSLELLKSYQVKLGLNDIIELENINYLSESGFISFENRKYKCLADVGDIGPKYLKGHGHSENMSFELSVGCKRLFVNSGIGTYQNGAQREYERSSFAHNTISINKMSSNEVWSSFRVARTSLCSLASMTYINDVAHFSIVQDGFKRLYKSYYHRREFEFGDNELVIRDDFFGKVDSNTHDAYFVLHVNSGWEVIENDGKVVITDERIITNINPPKGSTIS